MLRQLIRPLTAKERCPSCSHRFRLSQTPFRCTSEAGICLPEKDERFATIWKDPAPQGKVVAPPGAFARRAKCRSCGQQTRKRLCPNCHMELPPTTGELPSYSFAVVGAKEAGKSHFIAVLIDHWRERLGPAMDIELRPVGDGTRRRYAQVFADPIFKRRTTIDATRTALTNVANRLPLIYTLTVSGSNLLGQRVKRKAINLAFYDSAGEDLDSSDVMNNVNKYIYSADGIILLLDPLQLPSVRDQLGSDYSGRSGNFFAHTLIGAPEDLRHWPVDYVDWPRWQDRLECDDGQPPPTLAAVDLGGVAPPARLALDALAGFLGADGERPALLARMIRAALARAETDRAILLRDPGDQGLTWIACIQKAFPRQAALRLGFCTYQYDGYEAEAINVSVGETNFRFDDADFGYRYFAFDLLDGRSSEVPEVGAEYAAVVADWMTGAPARLIAFHRFMEGFDLPALDTGVLHGLRLFRLDQGEIALPTGADLEALLGFARDHTRPELRDRMLVLLADRLAAATADLSADEYGAMIGFLAQTARVTGKPAHRESAIAAWLQMFDRLVVGRGTALDETRAAETALLGLDPGAAEGLARRFVADDRLDALYPPLREADGAAVVAVADETLRQLAVAEPGRAWPDSRCGRFLCGLVCAARQPEPLLDLLVGAVAERPDDLATACRTLAAELRDAAPAQAEARLQTLGRRLGAPADAVRDRLDRSETHAVLRGEWLQRLDDSDDPSALLGRYLKDGLPRTPAFAKAADAWLRSRCFERLADQPAAEQAKSWLLAGELARLEPAALQRAAALLNDRLPMRSKDPAQLAVAEPLASLATDRGLALMPNRALILATVARVTAGDKVAWATLLAQLGGHLDGLSGKDYRALLERLLPAALKDCGNYKAHGQRVQALSVTGRRETLLKVYRKTLVYALEDPAALRQAVKYWLIDAAERPDRKLDPEVADILAAGLAYLESNQRADVVARIDKDSGISAEAKSAWKALQSAADGKRGPLAKLIGSVGRLFRSSRGDAGRRRR